MSKLPHNSKILQYMSSNNKASALDERASVERTRDKSITRPCVIPYYPKLAALLGNVYAAIFLQQAYHRYRNNGEKPFYKFLAPCSSEYYRKGDSWIEELSFTYSQLDRAIRTVATRISSTRKKPGVNKSLILSIDQLELDTAGMVLNSNALVLHWINRDRRTWWMVNLPLYISLLQIDNSPNQKKADQLIEDSAISLISNPAIRFPHAETSNIEKRITSPQNHFSALEKHLLRTTISPDLGDGSLNQYAHVVASACSVTFKLCSSDMADEILSTAQSLQAANRSLEQILLVGHWWKSHFWKGQRGTPPRPNDLLDMYGAAESFYRNGEGDDCCRVAVRQWRSTHGLEPE
ncbi:MAG TPA: hypothetical protein VF131_14275 [Blastocatellia bacterium]|nr:hypothetical protein [Blastocatellia bacterium]